MIEHVRTFAAHLLEASDLGSLCAASLGQLLDVADAHGGAVFVRTTHGLDLVASSGEPIASEVAGSHLVAGALNQTEPTWHVDEPEQGRTLTLVPLRSRDSCLGVVALTHDSRRGHDASRAARRELLAGLCQILSLAIHHHRALRDLEQRESLDPVSGLLNHHLGMKRLDEEVRRARRTRGRIGVLVIDLDHFKAVNDTHGTVVGDQLLISVAWGLQEVVRGEDVLAHCSGGTFMIVTIHASSPDIVRVAERARHQIANTVIAVKTDGGVSPVSVTASVGCVSFPDHPAQESDELFHAAREALAFAKNAGRDRVLVAGRLDVAALSRIPGTGDDRAHT